MKAALVLFLILPLVRSCYEAVGDQRSLEWLNWMCQPFGREGPSASYRERQKQMDAMKPSYSEQADQLSESWQQRRQVAPAKLPTLWKIAKYVSNHADEIREALYR